MRVAVKICAPNDVNGNPRRGWLVYGVEPSVYGRTNSCLAAFVDEGYGGNAALSEAFHGTEVLCVLDVPLSEYKTAMAGDTVIHHS